MVPMSDQEEAHRAFRYALNASIDKPGILSGETLVVHPGPNAWKSAKLLTLGDKETGAVSHQQLRVEQYGRNRSGPGYAFEEKPERAWLCEGAEVEAIRALLNGQMTSSGTWIRVDDDTLPSAMVDVVRSGELSTDGLIAVLRMLAGAPDLAGEIAMSDSAELLANMIQQRRQRFGLDSLRDVVMRPGSSETDIQNVLDNNWWVFGSRYIRKETRRRLTTLDTLDIPLIRADGALHAVEIKKANVPRLVTKPRSHVIVGPEVHEAAMQAINYLRTLDERRDVIASDFGIDCRRAFATVVVGHPDFAAGDHSGAEIAEAFRTYNAALSRVEVVTYKDLLDGAERALSIAGQPDDRISSPSPQPASAPRGGPWDPSADPPF